MPQLLQVQAPAVDRTRREGSSLAGPTAAEASHSQVRPAERQTAPQRPEWRLPLAAESGKIEALAAQAKARLRRAAPPPEAQQAAAAACLVRACPRFPLRKQGPERC